MRGTNQQLLALLGVAAVAGYQHRDKIREMINNARLAQAPAGSGSSLDGPAPGRLGDNIGGGFLGEVGSLFGAGRSGATLSGGLRELINRLQSSGHGPAVQSWVENEPNAPVRSSDLELALGDDLLAELEQRTGLSRAELTERLSTQLPETVNQLTPRGRVPSDEEVEQFLNVDRDMVLKEPR